MKHLQVFNSMEEFEAVKPSMGTPWVVLEKGTPKVIYSNLPEISEDDLTKGDFIDLGLSVKWASCNLGATKPCEYGDYYMWGSTTPNTDTVCDWAHAPFNNGASNFDKTYFNAHKSEWLDGNVLKTEYDAAYQATNGNAHMPTEAQFQELIDNTTSEWVNCSYLGGDHTEHTVMGRKFTTSNGNSIFIPASGYRDVSSVYAQGSYGEVWSSSLYSDYPDYAQNLYFSSGYCGMNNYLRYGGLSVRGVQDK